MTAPDKLDDYIDAAAAALDLPVEPEWKPAIRQTLELSLRLANVVGAFELPDEAEPAAVFTA